MSKIFVTLVLPCYNGAMDIGKRIEELRIAEGWSQTELANKVGVSQGTVSQWESGARVPSGDCVVTLAQIFDTSSDFLLGLVDEQIRLVPYFRELSDDEQLFMQAYAQLSKRQKRVVEELVAVMAGRKDG